MLSPYGGTRLVSFIFEATKVPTLRTACALESLAGFRTFKR